MSAEFYTILLPPQTLETLDNWGSLDDLPLSLDSSAWDTAGIYGLTVADGATASGSMEGSRQSVIPLGASLAHGGASFGATRIRSDSLTGTASTGGGATFQRIRNDALASGYAVFEICLPLRFRHSVFTATATLSGSLQATLLGNDRIYGYAYSGGTAGGQRTRTAFATLAAMSSGEAGGLSIRGLVLRASASASGQLSAESGAQLKATATSSGSLVGFVLGHGWQSKTRPPDGSWGERIVKPEPWVEKAKNAAEWAQNDTKTQGWDVEKIGIRHMGESWR